uniref:Uncharacterized protein n=1 Tax=Siphoviridae sp. ctXZx16 TaxID=2826371 RepID=A0A8S5MKJ3_9CAUD|nr:MAG TPA: hypothetical protein [Siphoviridae sp. ctXZx16]
MIKIQKSGLEIILILRPQYVNVINVDYFINHIWIINAIRNNVYKGGINMLLVQLKCEEDNLVVNLEVGVKPTIGDTIHVRGKSYIVDKVIWCIEEFPGQSGILAYIKREKDTSFEDNNKNIRIDCELGNGHTKCESVRGYCKTFPFPYIVSFNEEGKYEVIIKGIKAIARKLE